MPENQNIHLTSQEIAMCAEAVVEERFNSLPPALKQHLNECSQCSEEVRMVADILGTTELQNNFPKPDKVYRINHPVVSLLAAAAVLIFVVFYFYPASDPGFGSNDLALLDEAFDKEEAADDQEGKATDDNALIEAVNEDILYNDQVEGTEPQINNILLARFSPNEDLEKLFENYQSAFRGEAINVLTPSIVTLSETSELTWENPSGASLLVEIFNNEGDEVFTAATSSQFLDIPSLQPGLFYWKLISEEDFDLVFVGKIIYEN